MPGTPPPLPNDKKVTIRVPSGLWRDFREAARIEGVGTGAAVRTALDTYVRAVTSKATR